MKSKHMAALGLGACATACAASLALPAMLGAGVLGLGGAATVLAGVGAEVVICGAGALAMISGMVLLFRRKVAESARCASDGGFGCNPAKADAMGET